MPGSTPNHEGRRARLIGPSAMALLTIFLSTGASAPASADEADDAARLEQVEKEIRKRSLALVTVVKRMHPVETTTASRVDMVRVIVDGCGVTETMDADSRVIAVARLNEELELLENIDSAYRVRLPAGREGWLGMNCVQLFTDRREAAKIRYEDVPRSDVQVFLEVADSLFSSIDEQKRLADHVVREYRDPVSGDIAVRALEAIYSRILRHFERALDLHVRYIDGRTVADSGGEDSAVRGVSAWTEVFWGSGGYETTRFDSSSGKDTGGTRDLMFGGGFRLDPRSRLSFVFADKHDIIQSPYGSRKLDAGYDYSDKGRLHLKANVQLESYDDDVNDLNDYDRFILGSNADYHLSRETELSVNYNYLDHSHILDDTNSFGSHRIRGSLTHSLSPLSRVIVAARTNQQDSIAAIHNFSDFEPSFTFERRGEGKRLQLKTLYQTLSFTDIELKSYSRLAFQVLNQGSQRGGSRSTDLMVTWKDFPKNDLQSYLQVRGRFSKSSNGARSSYFTPSFYTNFYPNNAEINFSQFRVDVGGASPSFYSNLSGYFQLWHSPGDGSRGSVRPHVLDFNAKVGANSKYFRVGPALGIHSLISTEDGAGFFKRDGNLFRFGGFFEGRIPLPGRGELALNGGYEYGFVYNEELSVNQTTGEFTTGEMLQRHPTTLQVTGLLTLPLPLDLELVGRVNFYRIDTDIDERLSINPVSQNRHLIIVFGIRYRFES